MFTSTIPKADKDTKTSLSTTTVGPHSPDKKSVFTIPSAERYAVGAAAGTTRCYSFASFLVHITSSGIGFLGSNSSIIKGTEKKQMLNCSQCWFKNVSLVFFSFLSRASHLFQWKQIYFFFVFLFLLVPFLHLHTIALVFRAAIPVAPLSLQSLDVCFLSKNSFFHADPSARHARPLENFFPANKKKNKKPRRHLAKRLTRSRFFFCRRDEQSGQLPPRSEPGANGPGRGRRGRRL